MVHVCVLSVISYNAASTDAGLITERISRSTVSRRCKNTSRKRKRTTRPAACEALQYTRHVNAAACTGVSCAHLVFRAPPLFQVLSAPQAPLGGVAGAAASEAKNLISCLLQRRNHDENIMISRYTDTVMHLQSYDVDLGSFATMPVDGPAAGAPQHRSSSR